MTVICRDKLKQNDKKFDFLDLRPFVCKFEGCTESFNSPAREKKHRNRHYEPKAVCTICDMKFFDK